MNLRKTIALVAVIAVMAAFFMPWVEAESQMVGGISKILTGKHQASIAKISGFSVPIMANSSESRLAITVIRIFAPNVNNADKKSYLIWFVPLLAVFMLFISQAFEKIKWVHLGLGLLGLTVFAFATYKIKTTDMDKLVLNVKIAHGLWILLFGYLVIGLTELSVFFSTLKKKR